jgi:hypothetical protein
MNEQLIPSSSSTSALARRQPMRGGTVAGQFNQVAARFGVQEARADHGNDENRSRIGWQEIFPDFRRVGV